MKHTGKVCPFSPFLTGNKSLNRYHNRCERSSQPPWPKLNSLLASGQKTSGLLASRLRCDTFGRVKLNSRPSTLHSGTCHQVQDTRNVGGWRIRYPECRGMRYHDTRNAGGYPEWPSSTTGPNRWPRSSSGMFWYASYLIIRTKQSHSETVPPFSTIYKRLCTAWSLSRRTLWVGVVVERLPSSPRCVRHMLVALLVASRYKQLMARSMWVEPYSQVSRSSVRNDARCYEILSAWVCVCRGVWLFLGVCMWAGVSFWVCECVLGCVRFCVCVCLCNCVLRYVNWFLKDAVFKILLFCM